MGRVVISSTKEATPGDFCSLLGVTAHGGIQTRGVITAPDRPLLLWVHELEPGAEIRWDCPPVGHVAYVCAGNIEVGGTTLSINGAAIMEHGSKGVLRATAEGATLAHFHTREDHPNNTMRDGGNVHITVGETARRPKSAMTVYVDSACPTCELWLHRSDLMAPRQTPRHYHSQPEIIMVLDGELLLGRRTLLAGSALAIDSDTIYAFGVGNAGLQFINFRACESLSVSVDPKNEPLEVRSDRDIFVKYASG